MPMFAHKLCRDADRSFDLLTSAGIQLIGVDETTLEKQ